MDQKNIRNFCIIAHIDHGKSTLADRLLEMTGTVDRRDMVEQVLDSNPIERERGITIKLAPVRMIYKPKTHMKNKKNLGFRNSDLEIANSKQEFVLNLIDTPGHVDFTYEVSRSLAACEGAILVVDATQGVQAQTLANLTLARQQNLHIIPVINKIDLAGAQVEYTTSQLVDLGFDKSEIINISAKMGTHVDKVLKAIVERIPPPKGLVKSPLRALVFSSSYDVHKGVVVYVRVVDGNISSKLKAQSSKLRNEGDESSSATRSTRTTYATRLKFMASKAEFEPLEIGYFTPKMREINKLETGEVGYIATGLKDISKARVGDTITVTSNKKQVTSSKKKEEDNKNLSHITYHISPLPGYKEPKPMVFLGLYPIKSDEYVQVREAMAKLRLSDSAFSYRSISSQALGNGFHCGFLGLLHAEVVQERLSREFDLALLATAPTVEYKIKLTDHSSKIKDHRKKTALVQTAAEYPDPSTIDQTLEPVMKVTIYTPKKYVGVVMALCQDSRAEYIDLTYPTSDQAKFTYLIPLSEMMIDFFDRLKGVSQGYASLDYVFFDYQPVKLVRLDILLNKEKVDAFSQLVVEARAYKLGKMMVDRLKEVIPRQQFLIPVQAAVGRKVIARADIKAYRKDVTQKLYGGDRTRKDKLLKKQKKGKARMKQVGRVSIPQEAFLRVFKAS